MRNKRIALKAGPKPRNDFKCLNNEASGDSSEYSLPARRSSRAKYRPKSRNSCQVTPQHDSTSASGARETQPLKKSFRSAQKRMEDYDDDYLNSPMNEEDLAEWKGWCEIESDPAFFNSIIRDWGVKDVKIQEVFGLEDELLMMLPKPIYGLIFLFEYRADGPERMEECPRDVWFAHQVAENSCASVALMNLIMNIPDIEVGNSLGDFKKRTSGNMTPDQRGHAIKNCEFVRKVHNSFARKSDLFMVVQDIEQPRKPPMPLKGGGRGGKGKGKGKGMAKFGNKKRKNAVVEYETASGYHFIAFVPVKDKLWKLDGLDALPMNLGTFEGDWMEIARREIAARMSCNDDDAISFSLQALCKSPLATIPSQLAGNIAKLLCIETMLKFKDPDWAFHADPESSKDGASQPLLGPDEATHVTERLLAEAIYELEVREDTDPNITDPEHTVSQLMEMRKKAIEEQSQLRGAYTEEVMSVAAEEERSRARRRDRDEEKTSSKASTSQESSVKISTPKDSSSTKCSSPVMESLEQTNETSEEYSRHAWPTAECPSTSSPPRDTSSSKATTPPTDETEESKNEDVKDAGNEQQASESSIDIPLGDVLNIHGASSPS